MTTEADSIDWLKYTGELLMLLDQVERWRADEAKVLDLTRQRFAIAERHGFTVELLGDEKITWN